MEPVLLTENLNPRDEHLIVTALAVLAAKNKIKGRISTNQRPENTNPGITLEIGATQYDYRAQCKQHVDRKTTLLHAKHQLKDQSPQSLLITPYLSAEMADFCKEIDLQFIDLAGNAYLAAPGLYVFVKGQRSDGNQIELITKRSVSTITAMKIIFAFLCNPGLVNASHRDIAKVANVYLGAVGTVLTDLIQRGLLLEAAQRNKRRLIDPKRLINEWVINYPIILRPKLMARRFSAENPLWWDKVNFTTPEIVWSGEVAAKRITNYLKPITQTIYISDAAMASQLRELVQQHHLKSDPDGAIEILEKFWSFPSDEEAEQLAPAILIYADLMASLEPRNVEVAQMIKEELIDHVFD